MEMFWEQGARGLAAMSKEERERKLSEMGQRSAASFRAILKSDHGIDDSE